MHDLISQWRTWLAACGRPASTIRLRTHQILRFSDHHPDLAAVTATDMVAWLAQPGWAANTRRSNHAALRSFYGWAHAFGHVATDESRRLVSVKVPPPTPRPAPESVVKRGLLAAAPREHLMVELAARMGLRRGEIARIHTRDVVEDLVGWSLRVHGKGAKVRVVPMPDHLADLIRSKPDGWLFPSRTGGHLTEGHVGVLIARALPHGWTAHTLRHRFATTAYAGTRDLLAVQALLGHSRPETTRGYVQLPQDALRAAIAAAA
ncbi:MAG: tyrosine-type recombinase/integrase [Propionibacteriaceae bacterium]|nr:tyrosine-type recombinase/integrase [Propionibacteriaceae bacterium]